MKFLRYIFSFYGRANRLSWWLGMLLVAPLLFIISFLTLFILGFSGSVLQTFFTMGAMSQELTNVNPAEPAVLSIDELPLSSILITTTLIILAPFAFVTWVCGAITVKRYHDRNKSGWWAMVYYLPLLGLILSSLLFPNSPVIFLFGLSLLAIGFCWQVVECGFLAGTQGPNQFDGNDHNLASVDEMSAIQETGDSMTAPQAQPFMHTATNPGLTPVYSNHDNTAFGRRRLA